MENDTSSTENYAAQLASINAQLQGLAKTSDLLRIETSLEKLRGEMTEMIHSVASSKVEKAMTKQHATCALEFEKMVSDGVGKHEEKFHARTSKSPDAEAKRISAIMSALAPILKTWLPWLAAIAFGGKVGIDAINSNSIQRPAIVEPHKDTGE